MPHHGCGSLLSADCACGRFRVNEVPMNEQESLLAAIYEEVRLDAYDPSWPSSYIAERDRLLSVLSDTFIELQHIGSTSIPDLHAKPIIGILAGVESMRVAEAAESLCKS